jgi:hypothetical protein
MKDITKIVSANIYIKNNDIIQDKFKNKFSYFI